MLNCWKAEKWAVENAGELTQCETDFLAASQQAAERQKREREQAEREKAQTRRIRTLGILAVIAGAIAIIGASFAFSYYREADKHNRDLIVAIANAPANEALADEKDKEAGKYKGKFETTAQKLVKAYNAIKSPEDSPDQAVVEQAIKADNALQNIDKRGDDERRGKITIRYFPEDENKEKIAAALKDLNYKIVFGFSKDFETNAIWYGSGVCKHIEDVQLVAYALMRAGAQIKLVEQMQNSTGRENEIQVGGKRALVEKGSSKTVEDIRNLKSCPQQ